MLFFELEPPSEAISKKRSRSPSAFWIYGKIKIVRYKSAIILKDLLFYVTWWEGEGWSWSTGAEVVLGITLFVLF